MLDDKRILSDAAADAIFSAAQAEARHLGINVSIALVDDSGELLRFARANAVHSGTTDVAIAKARSAAMFRKSGKVLGEQFAAGAHILTALPNVLPIDGSEPINIAGAPLGGIGVSGSTPENDGTVARAGIAELQK